MRRSTTLVPPPHNMLSSTSGTAHAVQQQQQQQPARDAHAPPPRGAKRPRDVADAAGVDPLFERYGDLEIHEELLRDAARPLRRHVVRRIRHLLRWRVHLPAWRVGSALRR